MNERIRQLERQAQQLAQDAVDQKKYNTYSEYQQSLSDQSYAKFAQLIVRECARVVDIWSDEVPCSEGYDKFTVGKLKEHFGVEE